MSTRCSFFLMATLAGLASCGDGAQKDSASPGDSQAETDTDTDADSDADADTHGVGIHEYMLADAGAKLVGEELRDEAGGSVAWAGDMDGDGLGG